MPSEVNINDALLVSESLRIAREFEGSIADLKAAEEHLAQARFAYSEAVTKEMQALDEQDTAKAAKRTFTERRKAAELACAQQQRGVDRAEGAVEHARRCVEGRIAQLQALAGSCYLRVEEQRARTAAAERPLPEPFYSTPSVPAARPAAKREREPGDDDHEPSAGGKPPGSLF